MQLYLRHLFYNVLNRNSSDKVLKLLRKLHWEDPAVRPSALAPSFRLALLLVFTL